MTKMKHYLAAGLCVLCLQSHAAPTTSERIATLERQVARLTEQLNRLLAAQLYPAPPKAEQALHVCSISAFSDRFQAENSSRGRAKWEALKQCRSEHGELFCQDKNVQCLTYE